MAPARGRGELADQHDRTETSVTQTATAHLLAPAATTSTVRPRMITRGGRMVAAASNVKTTPASSSSATTTVTPAIAWPGVHNAMRATRSTVPGMGSPALMRQGHTIGSSDACVRGQPSRHMSGDHYSTPPYNHPSQSTLDSDHLPAKRPRDEAHLSTYGNSTTTYHLRNTAGPRADAPPHQPGPKPGTRVPPPAHASRHDHDRPLTVPMCTEAEAGPGGNTGLWLDRTPVASTASPTLGAPPRGGARQSRKRRRDPDTDTMYAEHDARRSQDRSHGLGSPDSQSDVVDGARMVMLLRYAGGSSMQDGPPRAASDCSCDPQPQAGGCKKRRCGDRG